MAKEKSLVEDAIIQMKNLEEAVAENAKGILASTMKQEIKELVKESLFEQEDEDEIDTDVDSDMEDMDVDADNQDTDVEDDMDMDTDMMDDDMEEPIDLTGKSDEEVLRVFQLMGPEDNIVVTKDTNGNINLKDNEANKEYMIVGEGEEEMEFDEMWNEEEDEEDDFSFGDDDDSIDSIVSKVFGGDDSEEMFEDDDMDDMSMMEDDDMDDMDMMEDDDMDMMEDDDQEIVYEISFDDEEISFDDEEDEMSFDDEEEMDFESMMESKMAKKSIKPKGVGMGKGPNVKVYHEKPNQGTGFKTKMKQGPKSVGTGKAKFEYKEGENLGDKLGKNKMVKKVETKEGVRTLGAGSVAGRKGGLPKPRAGSAFNTALKESDSRELNVLREKNEEYRKALNIFRNKLNEVAIFNSNLAYATRLFTEHSTSKQEKINILRRFDGVETIKESKNLYKVIKDELSTTTSQPMNESFERKIQNVPTTGSAVNLIESKTYENPQFLRMKDLMAKIK
jgi:hypothetical protein